MYKSLLIQIDIFEGSFNVTVFVSGTCDLLDFTCNQHHRAALNTFHIYTCVHEPLNFKIPDANEAVDFLEKMMERVRSLLYIRKII